jgi:hypothetical protein
MSYLKLSQNLSRKYLDIEQTEMHIAAQNILTK